MTLASLMDALQVHAAAAMVTAAGAAFTDVAVRFPQARGKSVSIFYGGERPPNRLSDETFNSKLVAQAVIVRGYWPVSETSRASQRATEIEIGTFVASFRTRVLGDQDLGASADNILMPPAPCETVVVAGTQYAVVDFEVLIDYDEFTQSR